MIQRRRPWGYQPSRSKFGWNKRRHTELSIFERSKRIDPATMYADVIREFNLGTGVFASGCCPFHDDHNPSFCMNTETGWFKCQATHCGMRGTNIVVFVASLHGINFTAALRHLERRYG